jgi:serine/threonine protein phosphatase PrpC
MVLAVHPTSGSVVVAVADGVSAATRSAEGAASACRSAIREVLRQLTDDAALDWRRVVEVAAWSIVDLHRLGSGEVEADQANASIPDSRDQLRSAAEQALKDSASTLVVACLCPREDGRIELSGTAVGDSGLGVLRDRRIIRILGGKEEDQDGITSSAVVALPLVPVVVATTTTTLVPGEACMVGTDGFWDPVGDGTGDVGEKFAETLSDGPLHPYEFTRLLDFSRETFTDDRTLAVIWIGSNGARP